MSVYEIRARRHTHPRLGSEVLSQQAVNWLLPDAIVMDIVDDGRRFVSIRLELDRGEYQAAIAEIAEALQRVGYSLLNAEVSEWVDRSVRAMLLSALAIGGGTAAASKKPLAAGVAALIAALIAREVESRMRRLEVVYRFMPSIRANRLMVPVSTRG
jgi:5-carboxymethyl-2-hydroxymuconate isomerase